MSSGALRTLVALALFWSCGNTPNPRSCLDGTCGDPRYPFCDVNGTLGGTENECISVTCMPGETDECRDDTAVVCAESGMNYTLQACDLECTPFGCRECDPNRTVCSGGVLTVCDENGQLRSNDACPLGCAPSDTSQGGRCLELIPSNGVGAVAPPNAFAADLDLSGISTIVVDDGSINSALSAPTVLVPAPGEGVPIRVFYGRNIRLGTVNVEARSTYAAIAFVASEEIIVEGTITLVTNDRAPGAMPPLTLCSGGLGFAGATASEVLVSGSGGGGHATVGGSGGIINNFTTPPNFRFDGGAANGTSTLVPLRGGCFGGTTPGGGAIQLSAGRKILVEGRIDARGAGGRRLVETDTLGSGLSWTRPNGGGAGGGILLEAASVQIGASAALLASGGSGASIDNDGQTAEGEAAAIGAAATTPNSGAGGDGASTTTPAANGLNGSYISASTWGGGGGGGLGRIRVNTSDASFASPPSAIEAGSLTVGTVTTH